MILSKFNLKNIENDSLEIPDESIFDLPEKVLQFGTGVLLRGLPDYFIDKANRNGIFNGRIVVVKSTEGGDIAAFEKQDSLYTHCVRGEEKGKTIEKNIVNSSISRVLSAKTDWETILECANNPDLQVIISNTTEVGIELVNDDIRRHPPVSFPGKLLAFLHERYKAFDGSSYSGMVILPTELITGNGKKLESIVIELAHLNGLDDTFIDWLENHNTFCNTLVDRIVPGKPGTEIKESLEKQFGYTDDLIIISEVYRLWAIEGNRKVKEVLSFAKADDKVIIVPDIETYTELKLRLLNASHTLSCGLSYLAGFSLVKSAMQNVSINNFVTNLLKNEISKAIPFEIDAKAIDTFGSQVLERFHNTHIDHNVLSITLNYSGKMKIRVLPVLLKYYELYNQVPENIAMGFAGYLLFMKAIKREAGIYYGDSNGIAYPIRDDKAAWFYKKWQETKPDAIAKKILHDTSFWGGTDLSVLPGFAESVQEKINEIQAKGILPAMNEIEKGKLIA